MKYNAAIETGTTGLWYGRLIELIGTHARAETYDLLIQELLDEINYHKLWLIKHDEPHFETVSLDIISSEFVRDVDLLGESGGAVARFEYDLQPVEDILLQRCLLYMDYNRMDLLNLLKTLSNEQFNYTPYGKKRNIKQILRHICNAEEWYITRLGLTAENIYEINLGIKANEAKRLSVFDRMSLVRKACKATLKEIIPQKDGVFTRQDYTNYPLEEWTARKVLRRFLEHEREHTYNIRWYLGLKIRSYP